jgi:glycosyltransferase involved in cell wall biosynthesis
VRARGAAKEAGAGRTSSAPLRLAFVAPLPPAPTGVAEYAVDVLGLLATSPRGATAPTFAIDVFHDQVEVDPGSLPDGLTLHAAGDLPERHAAQPYDLVLYQLGNSLAHAAVYALLPRLPGLVVLHDLVLHHARAQQFLDAPAVRAYAAAPARIDLRDAARASWQGYLDELAYTYPEQAERLAAVQLETVGQLLPYAYPLVRLPLEAARGVVVHNETMAAAVRAEAPDTPVWRVPMPMTASPVATQARDARRAQLGYTHQDVVVAAFGLLTPEKRPATLLRALARARLHEPRLRLLLVGRVPDLEGLQASIAGAGLGALVNVAGHVPFEGLATYLQACDIGVHLRYPSGRESSAALLRLMAQGRAVIVSDLEHQADLPDDAVVRVDLTDEEGGLARALLRLAARADERERLGCAAAAFVAREHSPERSREGYLQAITGALARPAPTPRPGWPRHWHQRG